jgi:hypothetical protein
MLKYMVVIAQLFVLVAEQVTGVVIVQVVNIPQSAQSLHLLSTGVVYGEDDGASFAISSWAVDGVREEVQATQAVVGELDAETIIPQCFRVRSHHPGVSSS